MYIYRTLSKKVVFFTLLQFDIELCFVLEYLVNLLFVCECCSTSLNNMLFSSLRHLPVISMLMIFFFPYIGPNSMQQFFLFLAVELYYCFDYFHRVCLPCIFGRVLVLIVSLLQPQQNYPPSLLQVFVISLNCAVLIYLFASYFSFDLFSLA